jgi:sec-independent protein translocase protein TatB
VFNVGGLELVAIALVALVVLGPDKLPAALRQAGSLLGQLRRMSDSFRVDVTAALAEDVVDRPGTETRID